MKVHIPFQHDILFQELNDLPESFDQPVFTSNLNGLLGIASAFYIHTFFIREVHEHLISIDPNYTFEYNEISDIAYLVGSEDLILYLKLSYTGFIQQEAS